MTSPWIPIEAINFDREFIRIDTRDFNGYEADFIDDVSTVKSLSRYETILKYPDRFCRPVEDVKRILKNLKEVSGGDVEWRCLYLDIRNGRNWDMKYIQIIKTELGYIITNKDGEPLKWDEIIEENIAKEILGAH